MSIKKVTNNKMQSNDVRESLYLDSELVTKCGIFYSTVTQGKITTTVDELNQFNKDWASEIQSRKGYDDFSLALKIENELVQLAEKINENEFKLNQAGIAEVLSSVQRFLRSDDFRREYAIVLDSMIKDCVTKLKPKQLNERLIKLKKQIEEAFDIVEPESFNTQYEAGILAVHILFVISSIYLTKSYSKAKNHEDIGELIKEIKNQETRFQSLLKKTNGNINIESKKYLEVAKAIRHSRIEAYKCIYENIICSLDAKCIERLVCATQKQTQQEKNDENKKRKS